MCMELENQMLQEQENKHIEALENTIEPLVEETCEQVEEIKAEDIQEPTNCVALTVREDYKMIVARNVFKKGAKMSWKVALSMAVIHFLNIFL